MGRYETGCNAKEKKQNKVRKKGRKKKSRKKVRRGKKRRWKEQTHNHRDGHDSATCGETHWRPEETREPSNRAENRKHENSVTEHAGRTVRRGASDGWQHREQDAEL